MLCLFFASIGPRTEQGLGFGVWDLAFFKSFGADSFQSATSQHALVRVLGMDA